MKCNHFKEQNDCLGISPERSTLKLLQQPQHFLVKHTCDVLRQVNSSSLWCLGAKGKNTKYNSYVYIIFARSAIRIYIQGVSKLKFELLIKPTWLIGKKRCVGDYKHV